MNEMEEGNDFCYMDQKLLSVKETFNYAISTCSGRPMTPSLDYLHPYSGWFDSNCSIKWGKRRVLFEMN